MGYGTLTPQSLSCLVVCVGLEICVRGSILLFCVSVLGGWVMRPRTDRQKPCKYIRCRWRPSAVNSILNSWVVVEGLGVGGRRIISSRPALATR